MPEESLFIRGKWAPSYGDDVIDVISPSTEEMIATVGTATESEVGEAVRSARIAFDEGPWRHQSLEERAKVIERAADLLEPHVAEIAHLVTSEMGAPISSTKAIVGRAVETMRFLADLASTTRLEELRDLGVSTAILKEPVGVVGAIAPWNGPFGMAVSKIVTPILAGCSVVFKPAPETPLDVRYLVNALQQAGLPDGVVNVVTGGASTGQALVASRGIDKVSFTGSTAAGRMIGSVCGHDLKRVQLELGGKSAAIVLDDADLDAVRSGLAMGCFFNSGQVCAALSRVLAPRSIYREVVAIVEEAAAQWRIGDPFDPETTLGPLVSHKQRAQVEAYIASGKAAGARIVTGGNRPAGLGKGWYVEPTVFADVDNAMQIAREEIFGPVAVVIPYEDEANAVDIANDSDYGLHGAVFTQDLERAKHIALQIRTGTFSVNNFVYNNRAPFGGVKASGIGRDTGREGFESFFELKTVNLAAGMESYFGQ